MSQPPLPHCQIYVSSLELVREGPGETSVSPHTAIIKNALALNTEWCYNGEVAMPSGGSRRWWSTASQGMLVLNCHRPVSCLCHRVSWWQRFGCEEGVILCPGMGQCPRIWGPVKPLCCDVWHHRVHLHPSRTENIVPITLNDLTGWQLCYPGDSGWCSRD